MLLTGFELSGQWKLKLLRVISQKLDCNLPDRLIYLLNFGKYHAETLLEIAVTKIINDTMHTHGFKKWELKSVIPTILFENKTNNLINCNSNNSRKNYCFDLI